MADAKTAMPQLARVATERLGVQRVVSPQVEEEYVLADEASRNEALQGIFSRPIEPVIEGNQSAMAAMAHQGSFQVWADTRRRRLQASGSIAMDIAKKLPEKSEMLASGTSRRYKLGVGDTLRDVVRGIKTRYGLAQDESVILKALAEVNQIRNNAHVGPGANLDLAGTLARLNQLETSRNTVAQPARGNAANTSLASSDVRLQPGVRAGF